MSHSEFWNQLFSHRVTVVGDCLEFTGAKDPKGYGRVGYQKKTYLAHRLSYLAQLGELPQDKMVCHSCDNPSCIKPEHLFLGSNDDNMLDMLGKGRQQKQWGEGHSQVRLTRQQVLAIRMDERIHRLIADEYGISLPTVANIKARRIWKNLESAAVSMGYAKGERNGFSKLTAEQVREIRADTRTQQQIADQYGVARTTIGAIKRGKNWPGV